MQGTASYKTEGGIKSLYLDGRAGYAEIPAIDFRKSSFSIAIRFNLQDADAVGHLVSDWSSPFQFRLFVYGKVVHVVLRRSGKVQFLLRLNSNRLVVWYLNPRPHKEWRTANLLCTSLLYRKASILKST